LCQGKPPVLEIGWFPPSLEAWGEASITVPAVLENGRPAHYRMFWYVTHADPHCQQPTRLSALTPPDWKPGRMRVIAWRFSRSARWSS
jgi:hypothetical protein